MKKLTTESSSNHDNLEQLSTKELLSKINEEDYTVADAVSKELASIEQFINAAHQRMEQGGRLFYIGSGTSGRLGIIDASECPPTYGVPHGLVVGIIAGGDTAIRKAVEYAEDDTEQGWKDLLEHEVDERDTLLGISASGTTPYVKGALQKAREHGMLTGSLSCNKESVIGKVAEHKIEVEVGPEFVTGSTRMKSGTAQKLVLNMISTTLMIKLGRVKGNQMVDMQLSNKKLVHRGTEMVMQHTQLGEEEARTLLEEQGSVRRAIEHHNKSKA